MQNRAGYQGLPGTGAGLHFQHFLTPLKRSASLLLLGPTSFIYTCRRSWGSEQQPCLSGLSAQGSQVSSNCMAWFVTPPSVRFHQAARVRREQGWRVRQVKNCPTSPHIVLLSMDSRHPILPVGSFLSLHCHGLVPHYNQSKLCNFYREHLFPAYRSKKRWHTERNTGSRYENKEDTKTNTDFSGLKVGIPTSP